MTRLRLLKVTVQAVFVIDDGEHLQEVQTGPEVVLPVEWPGYATGRFVEQAADLQAQLDG